MLGMTTQDMKRSDILEKADEKHAYHRTLSVQVFRDTEPRTWPWHLLCWKHRQALSVVCVALSVF